MGKERSMSRGTVLGLSFKYRKMAKRNYPELFDERDFPTFGKIRKRKENKSEKKDKRLVSYEERVKSYEEWGKFYIEIAKRIGEKRGHIKKSAERNYPDKYDMKDFKRIKHKHYRAS